MTERRNAPPYLVHADESCLGNQYEGDSPGGAGALVECFTNGAVTRRDFYLSSPGTTNNRMALSGAIELLRLLAADRDGASVIYCSDSQYLVKGMTEWVPNWERRGWRRKGGAVENLELWQTLWSLVRDRPVRWRWVRGHAGHVKNEYADYLAVQAATDQTASGGLRPSEFPQWLARQQSAGKFSGYDPDRDFHRIAKNVTTPA
jgi:ribonuclease HI